MLKKFIVPLIFASSFSLASDESYYQKAVDELFRGENEILYRLSEFPPGMKRIFNRYIKKMDPQKGGVVEFGEPINTGDILTEEPSLRLAFAFSSKEVGAILVQHAGGFGGHVNVVVFDTTKNWYCYTDLGNNLSYLDIPRIGDILHTRIEQGKLPSCNKW